MNLGKLTVPLLMLAPLLAAAAGAGASYAVTKEKIEQIAHRQAVTDEVVSIEREKSAKSRETAAAQAATLDYLKSAMERIENHLGTRR